MAESFIGKSRDMGASDDRRNPPLSEPVPDLVGAPDARSDGRDRDQVRFHGVGIDVGADVFVVEGDIVMIRRMPRQIAMSQRTIQQLRTDVFFCP